MEEDEKTLSLVKRQHKEDDSGRQKLAINVAFKPRKTMSDSKARGQKRVAQKEREKRLLE